MTNLMKPLMASAALLALAACGDSGDETAKSDATAATEAAATAEKSTMEKATEMATKAAEALKLDTSSLDAFKSSLAGMKASLSDTDQSKLTEALAGLAKDAGGDSKSGLMDAAKSMASGKSMTETLYEKLGDKLDGKTFEDILAMAG
ncbi:MAG: hypothetical protein HWE25_00030 [Alphaproteobacteria bacterium]|nr:hypothetical protein [Alphaproteobacteria bacterium]